MRIYELTYLISPELSEKEAKDLQAKIVSLIQEQGGLFEKENSPLKKTLAYPVKKQEQAYLTRIDFQLLPEKLLDFEKSIKAESKILRYLLLSRKKRRAAKPARKTEKSIRKITKPKAKLKEIEQKLEEILGNNQKKVE